MDLLIKMTVPSPGKEKKKFNYACFKLKYNTIWKKKVRAVGCYILQIAL